MATGGKTQETKSSPELLKERLKSFDFLRKITNGFSVKICGDPFGTVYKGTVPDSNKEIAVKKLEQITPIPWEDFENKVQNIMELKHENIVELVGFCNETQKNITERLLCYEYAPKGSLQRHLFVTKATEDSSSAEHSIDWDIHFKIVKGICRGLLFLHSRLSSPLIHMDLKLENIWLDEAVVPKIANVGLSRIFGEEQTKLYAQKVVESHRYMAPEYLYNGEISTRSDIYSLGVMIIQIATGEENCHNKEDNASRKYIDKIRKDWTAEHIASKYSSLDSERLHQVHACIKIGLECVQIDERNRPSIEEIVNRLNTI